MLRIRGSWKKQGETKQNTNNSVQWDFEIHPLAMFFFWGVGSFISHFPVVFSCAASLFSCYFLFFPPFFLQVSQRLNGTHYHCEAFSQTENFSGSIAGKKNDDVDSRSSSSASWLLDTRRSWWEFCSQGWWDCCYFPKSECDFRTYFQAQKSSDCQPALACHNHVDPPSIVSEVFFGFKRR